MKPPTAWPNNCSIGTGEVSKQIVKWSCSFQSPDEQEGFWKFLEDVQGVKSPLESRSHGDVADSQAD